ncbi:hypothetical protein JKP88DRAFT_257865 [Tribonema minus]|uniref:RNA-binding S4 domain-containing protein n=1 Tax=Tribonema minus TaxID=303371 RepID=A0A836CE46_9STRA|nr:hypothetical protein JKP88DRAFT_257865 [Tribonema minus]
MKAGGSSVLPKDKLLSQAMYGGVDKQVATRVLDAAASALRNWELMATDFLTPPEYNVMLNVLEGLVDLQAIAWGGHEEAERRRMFFAHDGVDMATSVAVGVVALEVGGQFLFDMADHRDYLGSILGTGIERQKVGDILVQGERGAQVLCHPDIADYLCTNLSSVRSVTVKVDQVPLTELKVSPPIKKHVTSVEASLRLDAIASAGMGMSRSKMADAIKSGMVFVNWREAKGPSSEVKASDVITVRGKGRLEILEIHETKKERYRVVMNRVQ